MSDNHEAEQPPGASAPDPAALSTALIQKVVSGIFSDDRDATWRVHLRRWWIGGAGGIFYTALKNYFGAGIGVYGILTMDPTSPRRGELMFGYVSAYMASAAIGGFVAWLSAQKSGRLLFLIGMFGVQILLTLYPGLQSVSAEKTGWLILELRPISPAFADDEQKCVGDSAFVKGFKAAFGVRTQYDKYAVVVASGKNPDDAQAKLKTIAAQNSNLTLRVGPRACDNDYYPVLASDYLPLSDAKALLDKVRKSSGVSDAFLAPGLSEY
jgi:hypothetical protein